MDYDLRFGHVRRHSSAVTAEKFDVRVPLSLTKCKRRCLQRLCRGNFCLCSSHEFIAQPAVTSTICRLQGIGKLGGLIREKTDDLQCSSATRDTTGTRDTLVLRAHAYSKTHKNIIMYCLWPDSKFRKEILCYGKNCMYEILTKAAKDRVCPTK